MRVAALASAALILLSACAGVGPGEATGRFAGAAAGAALGANLGNGDGQAAAVVVGALLGARAGGAIGRMQDPPGVMGVRLRRLPATVPADYGRFQAPPPWVTP